MWELIRIRARGFLARYVLPPRCAVCGADSLSSVPACPSCAERLLGRGSEALSFSGPVSGRCDRCGRPLVSAFLRCIECREKPILTHIDGVTPLFPYTPASQALLTAWKVEGRTALTDLFADCLARAIPTDIRATVIPVPPRPGKVRERGWDQIEAVARVLERRHGVSVSRCLERKSAFQQKKLGRLARTENMRGGISFIEGNHVPDTALVIDDLMTTGSTLDACAEALKGAGCRKVRGVTLFYD